MHNNHAVERNLTVPHGGVDPVKTLKGLISGMVWKKHCGYIVGVAF